MESSLQRRSIKPAALMWRRWEDGRVIGKAIMNPKSEQTFGSPSYVTHRAHLYAALHDAAIELGVVVHLNKTTTRYDPEEGTVCFDDGLEIQADLVAAADELKSPARHTLNCPKDTAPRGHGLRAYRATLSPSTIRKDHLVKWTMEAPNLSMGFGHDRHVMSYAIAEGDQYNMVITDPIAQPRASENLKQSR